MGLESGSTIGALNANWPLGTDPKAQGDDHLRLVKAALKATFPAGWNDAPIDALMWKYRATVPSGQATAFGALADIPPSYGWLADTPTFVATSPTCFVDGFMNVAKTAAANGILCGLVLIDVTASNANAGSIVAEHGCPATSGAVASAYTPHPSGIISSMTVGHTYRLQMWGNKWINEGVMPVTRYRMSVHNV